MDYFNAFESVYSTEKIMKSISNFRILFSLKFNLVYFKVLFVIFLDYELKPSLNKHSEYGSILTPERSKKH